jgi:HPt (histidine-containing phosphotransfer) domain-containing protein
MAEEKYNIKGIANELGVSLEEIAGLYSTYILEMRSEISEIKGYRAESNWRMVERVSHNIMGVSANLGILDVYEGAAEINQQMKSGNTEDIDISLIKLEHSFNSAEREIIKFFTNNGLPLSAL